MDRLFSRAPAPLRVFSGRMRGPFVRMLTFPTDVNRYLFVYCAIRAGINSLVSANDTRRFRVRAVIESLSVVDSPAKLGHSGCGLYLTRFTCSHLPATSLARPANSNRQSTLLTSKTLWFMSSAGNKIKNMFQASLDDDRRAFKHRSAHSWISASLISARPL